MRYLTIAASLVFALLSPAEARAQGAFRTTEDKTGLWLTYTGEHAVAGRWAWLVDGNIRRGEFASEWRSILVRSGVQWQLNPNVKFGGGYGFSYLYPGGSASRLHTPEHRIYQQVVLAHGAGRASLLHRYRFENRWFAQQDTVNGSDDITGWLKRQRARYQIKATL
ncbi:MAG: DUF2490 domain-containing protein, partial [Gemmatimonadota bacterium]